jgi:hypothetical protein
MKKSKKAKTTIKEWLKGKTINKKLLSFTIAKIAYTYKYIS